MPPKKRPRRNSNEDQRTRSKYWFEDGNVVLQAENTLFRVHQSILSRHSEIFKDTFAMPQDPSQENENVDNCPVIPLADSAEDLGNIISLLYDNNLTLKFGNKLPARVLGSMLRLGRKYVIDHLENEAMERLHNDYPTSLDDWESLCDDNRQIEDSQAEVNTTTEIVSIAHEFRLFTIMPAAYAQYLELQTLEEVLGDTSIPDKARADCILGRTRILGYVKDRTVDALCRPMVIPSKACNGSKCQANRSKTLKTLPVWKTEESESFGIFGCGIGPTENLCSQCQNEVFKLTDQVRSDFWSILPSFFGLSPWADLKDDL